MGDETPTLTFVRWTDPVVDVVGQPVTSRYAETFWLPVIGPTSLWLLRHVAVHTGHGPYEVDAETVARSLGIGHGAGKQSPLMRTLHRLQQFRLAHHAGGTWALPANVGPLPKHNLDRLPEVLRRAHYELTEQVVA